MGSDSSTPDLQKLRRFALLIALVLVTHSVAGVELRADETIRPFGLPFKIARPDLLPIGLIVASVLTAVRFWFYGMMATQSPAARRRRMLTDQGGKPWLTLKGFYPANYPGALPVSESIHHLIERVEAVFPKVPGTRITEEMITRRLFDTERDQWHHTGEEEPEEVYDRVRVPYRLRVAARFQDLDYTAPIWLNAIALGLAGARLVWP